jgi:hypothetical protein
MNRRKNSPQAVKAEEARRSCSCEMRKQSERNSAEKLSEIPAMRHPPEAKK